MKTFWGHRGPKSGTCEGPKMHMNGQMRAYWSNSMHSSVFDPFFTKYWPTGWSKASEGQGCRIMETLETCFQPLLNFGSHIWLAGPKAQPASQLWQPNLTGWVRGPASQMARTKPHGCDSAKCLQLSRMASNQPNG